MRGYVMIHSSVQSGLKLTDTIFFKKDLLFGTYTCPWIYRERLDSAEFVWRTLYIVILSMVKNIRLKKSFIIFGGWVNNNIFYCDKVWFLSIINTHSLRWPIQILLILKTQNRWKITAKTSKIIILQNPNYESKWVQ